MVGNAVATTFENIFCKIEERNRTLSHNCCKDRGLKKRKERSHTKSQILFAIKYFDQSLSMRNLGKTGTPFFWKQRNPSEDKIL